MSRALKRSAARMSAVQALYEMDITQKGMNDVFAEFEAHWIGQPVDDDLEMRDAELSFFKDVVGGVIAHQKAIDQTIDKVLAKGWPLVRIEVVLRAIMRAGVYELTRRKDVPPKVSISEYVDVTHAFYGGEEPGMVNAVMDQVARELRADELGPKHG